MIEVLSMACGEACLWSFAAKTGTGTVRVLVTGVKRCTQHSGRRRIEKGQQVEQKLMAHIRINQQPARRQERESKIESERDGERRTGRETKVVVYIRINQHDTRG